MRTRNEARIQEMKKLRSQKWTLKRIGKKFGITRQRVGQLIGKTGTVFKMIEGGSTNTA